MTMDTDTPAIGQAPCAATEQDHAAQLQARREQVRIEVEHLFRHSLRNGQLNPLLHPITRYRMEQAA
jgi:hypothetical protein